MQLNFNGSNTFGTIIICSRQGSSSEDECYLLHQFRGAYYGYLFYFLQYVGMLHVFIRIEAILMSTHYIFVNNKKRKSICVYGFFQGTLKRVRNSRGKQAISVRATEGLLYLVRIAARLVLVFLVLRLFDTVYLFQSILSRFPKTGRKKREIIGERKIPNSPIPPPANTVDPCLLLSKLHQEPSEISLKGPVKMR